jgi:hypothetical protein
MNTNQKSWSSISKDFAKQYLKYYPREAKHKLCDFINETMKDKKAKILELGCGNCQNYEIYNKTNKIDYTGVDFSKTLLDAAIEEYKNNNNFSIVYSDLYDYLENNNEIYDITLIFHVFELIESQDLILDLCSKCSNYIAILWYEPPIHDHHIVELKDKTYPDRENTPYLRIKTSKDYYSHLLKKHNLTIEHRAVVDPKKQVLDILKVNK